MVRSILPVAVSISFASIASAQLIVFNENNDGSSNQLTASVAAGPGGWTLQNDNTVARSGAGFWTADNPAVLSDYRLTTPVLTYTSGYTGPLALSFWHEFDFEDGFDGAVVEISVNGGAFIDIGAGAFTVNGYTGTIDATGANPMAGRQAFTGTSPGFNRFADTGWINSAASIGGLSAGDTFQVRFRSASDNTFGGGGWMLDDVNISATPVPEPTGLVAAAVGAIALMRRKRRYSR